MRTNETRNNIWKRRVDVSERAQKSISAQKLLAGFSQFLTGRKFYLKLVRESVIKMEVERVCNKWKAVYVVNLRWEKGWDECEREGKPARASRKKRSQEALWWSRNCLWIDWRRNVTFLQNEFKEHSPKSWELACACVHVCVARRAFLSILSQIYSPRGAALYVHVYLPFQVVANEGAACIMRDVWFCKTSSDWLSYDIPIVSLRISYKCVLKLTAV